MTNDLKQLMTDILAVKPPYGDISSNGIPGMAMPNMGADVVNELRKVARSFAETCANAHSKAEAVQAKAVSLEGALRAATTVGVLEDKICIKIIDELYALVDGRV